MDLLAVIGLDIGTTSVKAVAYDNGWRELARAAREYPLISPLPSAAEQDPQTVVEAALEAISEAVAACPQPVEGVGLSAAMHTLIALDDSGAPLTGSLTYADGRAAQQAREIPAEIYRRTGTPAHPMSPLAKLMWFRQERPDIFRRAVRWVSIKEYLMARLFGEAVVDHSIASATGLFNLRELDWDRQALELAGISRDRLSTPVPATHVMAGMGEGLARRIGVDAETPFVAGASDGTLDNLGVGAVEEGVVACSIGTSGAVRAVVGEPAVDAGGGLFCYALTDGMWVTGGPVNNGGLALRWLRDEVFPEAGGYEAMSALAAEVPAGAGGLVFLPYLTGERAPYWDSRARGGFVGLSLEHGRAHMVRAVMEGVALAMRAVARRVEDVVGEARAVRATGGFARSGLWRQILADVLDREILFPESAESACRGAALVARHALGEVGSLREEAVKSVSIARRHSPEKVAAGVYGEMGPLFERLYERLEPEFGELARLRGERG